MKGKIQISKLTGFETNLNIIELWVLKERTAYNECEILSERGFCESYICNFEIDGQQYVLKAWDNKIESLKKVE